MTKLWENNNNNNNNEAPSKLRFGCMTLLGYFYLKNLLTQDFDREIDMKKINMLA